MLMPLLPQASCAGRDFSIGGWPWGGYLMTQVEIVEAPRWPYQETRLCVMAVSGHYYDCSHALLPAVHSNSICFT